MTTFEMTDVKSFMNHLFLKETFDAFCLSEATFVTFNTFRIDGSLKKDYYFPEELENSPLAQQDTSVWRQVRPFCLELIKGKHTPLEFKIIFRLSLSNVKRLLEKSNLDLTYKDIHGLFLNLHYQSGRLTCTTGISLAFFTMDKTLDHVWDDMVTKFFLKQNLNFNLP